MGLLNDIINLKQNDKSKMSLLRGLTIFYMFIFSGYLKDLQSGQLKEFIEGNRYVQHLIGFIFIMVIFNMYGKIDDFPSLCLYSIIGYIWFILTTKLDLQWSLAFLILALLGFFYENSLNQKEKNIANDKVLTNNEKEKIREKHNMIKYIINGTLCIVVITGLFFYANRKTVQYGGGFDLDRFFLGKN